jgi:hypothetical protein
MADKAFMIEDRNDLYVTFLLLQKSNPVRTGSAGRAKKEPRNR